MKLSASTGVFAVLLLAALTARAQIATSADLSKPNQAAKSGSITGRVINESGEPLPNAGVFVRAFGSTAAGYSATTNREGRFEVTGLAPLNYQVSAYLPAYTPLPRDPENTQTSYYHIGDSVTLALTKGGVITGTVTTQNGDPVVRVRVAAQMIRTTSGQRLRAYGFMRDHSTDDRGIYRIYGLPAGTYIVWAGGGRYFGEADAYDRDVPSYAPGSTRDLAAEITVRVGSEADNIDIRYRGEVGRTVSGTVSGPQVNADIPGVRVTLSSASDGGVQMNTATDQPAGGGFVFYGVDDGEYDVVATTSSPNQQFTLSAPKRITVRGADVGGVELVTKPLGSVAGRLVLEPSKAPECTDKRQPVFTETAVSAWHNDNDAAKNMPPFVWGLGAPVQADAEGNFLLKNLAPAQYYFVARFSAKYWYLQSITLPPTATAPTTKTAPAKPIDATRAWTNVKSGDRLSGLTITLAQGAASIRGQLALNEGEQAPAKLFVYLVPAEREKAEEVLRFYAAPVSPEGKIVMNNLAPGRYWVLARSTEGIESPLTKIRLPHETETRARLRRDAEAAKTEVELKPCQNLVDFRLPFKSAQ